MLLNAEELLALVNGDAEPDRLADLLDRLENCPDSAAALQVLVALRANREEGLEALQEAAETDSEPIPHPSWHRSASSPTRWGMRPLRLAASIAIVGILGILAATTFLGGDSTVVALATEEYADVFSRQTSNPAEPTAEAVDIREAASLIGTERYEEARAILIAMPNGDSDKVVMYLGMIDYFTEDYVQALIQFAKVSDRDDTVRHQTSWYEANALLALNRPMDALISLERLSSLSSDWWYQRQAAVAYDAVCEALGINSSSVNKR